MRQQEITSSQIVKLPDLKLQEFSDDDFDMVKYSFAQISQFVHEKTRNNVLLIKEFNIQTIQYFNNRIEVDLLKCTRREQMMLKVIRRWKCVTELSRVLPVLIEKHVYTPLQRLEAVDTQRRVAFATHKISQIARFIYTKNVLRYGCASANEAQEKRNLQIER